MRRASGRWAVASVLVAGAVAWLWWHGRRAGDALVLMGPGARVAGVLSYDGEVFVGVSNVQLVGAEQAWTAQTVSFRPESASGVVEQLVEAEHGGGRWGFSAGAQSKGVLDVPGGWYAFVGVPHWLVMGVCAWPVGRWVGWRGVVWRRRRRGWCVGCGYDLRGGGGVCPECGGGA